MKKLLFILSVLLVFSLVGCTSAKNTSSNTDANSSSVIKSSNEIVSSDNENSSEAETSSEETASTETSLKVSSEETPKKESKPTSNTQSSSKSTTSTNKNESKVEASSTPQNPATPTYLEQNNLKLTSINTNICFNTEEHECMKNKKISIGADSHINIKNFASFFQYEPFVSSDINKYKTVTFTLSSSENGLHWNCGSIDNVIPFDKYTGAVLAWGIIGNGTWREVATNDRNIYVTQQIGHREYEYEHTIICPMDYDGIIFAVVKDVEIPWGELSYGKPYNIDEIIDFKNNEYYLFAPN